MSFTSFFLSAALCLCLRPHSLNADFMAVIPDSGVDSEKDSAWKSFLSSRNNTVNIVVEASDFETAKHYAERISADLDAKGIFSESLSDAGSFDVESLTEYVNSNVYALLDKETQRRILDDPAGFAEDRMAAAYSAFGFSSMAHLETDPFLLEDLVLRRLVEKVSRISPFTLRDGFLTSENDGVCSIFMTGTLKEPFSLFRDRSGIDDIFSLTDDLNRDGGVRVYLSGTPLHTAESSKAARAEIACISTVSVALILVLFYLFFRNLHILVPFLFSLFMSLASAASALALFFGEIHVVSLIFGTSLIGTCIDYSVHYYVCYARRLRSGHTLTNPFFARDRIFQSLTVGFLSTACCYSLLFFSSYPVLRQIAAFCVFGLLSSYITTLCFFPKIVVSRSVSKSGGHLSFSPKTPSRNYLLPFCAVVCLVFAILFPRLRIHNDISSLYRPSERLMSGERVYSSLTGYSDVSFALIRGGSMGEALERTSVFTDEAKKYANVLSVSTFFPSLLEEERSIEAARRLLPYVDEVGFALGLDDAQMDAVKASIREAKPVAEPPEALDSFVIGRVGEHIYTAAVITNPENADAIRDIAERTEGVFYMQTARDISRSLDRLTRRVLSLFSLGCALIFLILILSFGFKRAVLTAMAPISVILGTICICHITGHNVDFFSTVALTLVLGLGLDYIAFMTPRSAKTEDSSSLSVFLSFLTTEMSFGILALSGFPPVRIFGFVIFIGIMLAYICSLLCGGAQHS